MQAKEPVLGSSRSAGVRYRVLAIARNLPSGREVDVPLVYADYYFLEALIKYEEYYLAVQRCHYPCRKSPGNNHSSCGGAGRQFFLIFIKIPTSYIETKNIHPQFRHGRRCFVPFWL